MIPKIDGEWHVLGTTFPMWKKGDKFNPRFRYAKIKVGLWRDEVIYENKEGKTKTIKGKDRLQDINPPKFIWRGDGLLFIAVSKWQIDYMSEDGNMALITFKKTLFTPSGADVISRSKNISETEKMKMLQILHERFNGRMDEKWMWLK